MELIIKLIFCHLMGDFVLQIDYIAQSKGNNWYHLFVHCGLYTLPFYVAFGYSWHLIIIFGAHFIVDMLKARYKKINYPTDQVLHYITCLVYFISLFCGAGEILLHF